MSETIKPPAENTGNNLKIDSKLSSAQQEQVHSAKFIEWFGDWENDPDGADTSKIVNPDTGEPKVFYHGTNRQFDISEAPEPGAPATLSNHGLDHDYKGIYVSDSPELSAQYADPLGAHFVTTMNNLASSFGFKKDKPSGEGFLQDMIAASRLDEENLPGAIGKWNEILASCQARDGRLKIEEGGEEYDIDDFHELLERGVINYSSSLSFDGIGVSWVGEMLQTYGGRFLGREDELMPYSSLYPEHQKIVEAQAGAGNQILIPAYARPRIIPVFIRSVNPLYVRMAQGHEFKALDSAFAGGFAAIEAEPGKKHDAIVAIDEFEGSGNIGTNIAVLDSRQFLEAAA
ncbi:MAG TPA: hypothetical protein VFX43_15835 [Chitinophagaceae bacterium]|nr:hypothetical protein [Chitinophagaceae bacterium]